MLFVAQGDFISFTRATFDIYFTYYMPTCYLWHFKYGQPLLAKNRKSVFGTTPVHINHWNHLLQFPHRLQTWRSSSLWCGANLNATAEMRVAQFYVAALCFSVWGGTTQSIQRVKFLRLIIICPEAVTPSEARGNKRRNWLLLQRFNGGCCSLVRHQRHLVEIVITCSKPHKSLLLLLFKNFFFIDVSIIIVKGER